MTKTTVQSTGCYTHVDDLILFMESAGPRGIISRSDMIVLLMALRAVREIAAMEPGSKGAYNKFARAYFLAKRVIRHG